MVRVGLGVLRFLFMPLLFLGQTQLIAASLELLCALRLFGRLVLARETLNGYPSGLAIRIAARPGLILIALHQHAIERHSVLHELRDGHGGYAARTAGRGRRDEDNQTTAGNH